MVALAQYVPCSQNSASQSLSQSQPPPLSPPPLSPPPLSPPLSRRRSLTTALSPLPAAPQANAQRTNAHRHTRPNARAHAHPAHPCGGSALIILDLVAQESYELRVNTRPQSPGPRLGGGLHYHTKPLTRRVRRIGSGAPSGA